MDEAKPQERDSLEPDIPITDDSVIVVRGLNKSYGKVRVLNHLDLTVEHGAAIGLLGPNGAGKTTLLKTVMGLIPADAGRCTVFGEPSRDLSPSARTRLAYVPQVPAQFPWLTAQAMLRYISAFYPGFDWDYAHELAGRWKLALRTQIGVLSPGQQQRLSIVRALATRPDLVILDEPIASLDPATRIAVIDELLSERSKRRITIIFSSHLIGDLERLCSQFAILLNGKIAVFEDVEWFRGLVRASIEGEEQALAQAMIQGALVRKDGNGRTTVILERSGTDRLASALPHHLRMVVDEPGLEAIAAEWMR